MGYELTIILFTYRLSKLYCPPFGALMQDQVKTGLLVGKSIYSGGRVMYKLCFLFCAICII